MKADFDVIIIGGSYAGLSAAMALGRALRNVLVIDAGQPCNRQTPHAHNFITNDGETPATISAKARKQVMQYPNVHFYNGTATAARENDGLFVIETDKGESNTSRKLLFATGIVDVMPAIPGIEQSWGISVLHCPYCHGYEVRNQPTAIFASGEVGFEFAKIINNWTKELTLLTNGPSQLTSEQITALAGHNISVNETPVTKVNHQDGYISNVAFADGSGLAINAMYAKFPFRQTCELPQSLGCALTEHGFIKIDEMQATTVNGVFAAGDNTTMFRSLSIAIAAGNRAGAMINHQMINEDF
ncbi:NAD(P)/FAD-dependent oxidoreductase [Mucilaginibacter sp. ZT4R22]|uniref:NAD(P)/FAD-dependent oxidoreductase n=1 Tax=Mucilaginibacter pankratovii TaxID=2772110 RepID=A0ABR7WJI9_9SPHI|nr:NAD(P)/FAD-dependent oxidoreductase [Mucilaginibacter pankratovii]MBD1362483.1 NAD(P)/FAD-dependent oxidoreductase [Mucilaginibacter pankratovii]